MIVCEVGGDCKGPIDQHHDDYDKPDETRPMCRRHHKLWHAANGRGANWQPSSSILIRAAISRDEWKVIRKMAIEQRTSPSKLVAAALRTTYDLRWDVA